MEHWVSSLRALAVITLLTGVVYTASITAVGRILYPAQVSGSLLEINGKVMGSSLIAQKANPASFQPRPSAGDFATVASGASNLGPTSIALKKAVDARRADWGAQAPAELLFASGSGLDPHLSPQGALYQVERVAKARSLTEEQRGQLIRVIDQLTEKPTFGFLGQSRVNVLLLNLALESGK